MPSNLYNYNKFVNNIPLVSFVSLLPKEVPEITALLTFTISRKYNLSHSLHTGTPK